MQIDDVPLFRGNTGRSGLTPIVNPDPNSIRISHYDHLHVYSCLSTKLFDREDCIL